MTAQKLTPAIIIRALSVSSSFVALGIAMWVLFGGRTYSDGVKDCQAHYAAEQEEMEALFNTPDGHYRTCTTGEDGVEKCEYAPLPEGGMEEVLKDLLEKMQKEGETPEEQETI